MDVSDPNNLVVAEHVGSGVVNLIARRRKLFGSACRTFWPTIRRSSEKRPDATTLDLRVDGAITAVGDKDRQLGSKTKLAVASISASTSTRVVICALDGQALRFLGYGEGPVQAWNKGRLSDRQALAESIRFALHEAELRAGASPESAVIGMGGCVAGVNSRGIYEFGRRREIEAGDLRYAVELACARAHGRRPPGAADLPAGFHLDGRAGYRNPKGILGARLEANVHVVTASLQEHQALISAVHRRILAVEESIFEADRRGLCRCTSRGSRPRRALGRYRRAIDRCRHL